MFAGRYSADENPVASLCRGKQEKFGKYDSRECQKEIGCQLEFIWQQAEDSGLVLNYQGLNNWAAGFDQEAGAEHVAVLIPEENKVFKRTIGSLNGELFGVEMLPIPYLLNQGLISFFFGIDSQFEGLSRRPHEGTTEFLISQKYIKAADVDNPYPTQAELLDFFNRKGFECEGGNSDQRRFVNEKLGLAIIDSHPGNFIVNVDGIKPFDIHFEILHDDSIAAITDILS